MADLVIENAKVVDGLKLTIELLGIASSVTPNHGMLIIHDCVNNAQAMDIYNRHIANIDNMGFPTQTEVYFSLPVRAPDFLVSSPTPKTDPLEALNEAVAEGGKSKKSIASMALNFAVYLLEAEKKIKVKIK